jgi:succinate dehydrogenase / fumarate reductase cytochrome b subunit
VADLATGRRAGVGSGLAAWFRRAVFWLQPRWRDPGWLAFALNRFTGMILIFYLALHLVVLSRLADGQSGWNSLLELFGSRPFLVGDTLLIGAVVFHGLNGLRVAALTLGLGVRRTGVAIAVVIVLSALLTGLAGWAILFR